jgi:hypothetical protein
MSSVARGVQYDTVMGKVEGDKLTLWFMSLDISLWETINGESDGEDLSFSCDISKTSQLVSAFKSETLELSQESNSGLLMKSGNNSVSIPYFMGRFNEIQPEPEGSYIGFVDSDFFDSIDTATGFISKVSDSPQLDCVLISCSLKNGISVFSTDKVTFFYSECVISEFTENLYGDNSRLMNDILLPKRAASLLKKLFSTKPAQLYMSDKDFMVLKDEEKTAMFSPYNEKYPDVICEAMQIDGEEILSLNKEKCIEALNVSAIANDTKLIHMCLEDNDITIKSPKSLMESNIKLDDSKILKRIDSVIGFNSEFLENCLKVIKDDYVTVERINGYGIYRIKGKSRDEGKSSAIAPISI